MKKNTNRDLINSNLMGFQNIIEFANKKKIKQFYHLSSLNVYGEIKSKLLTETNSFNNPDLLELPK